MIYIVCLRHYNHKNTMMESVREKYKREMRKMEKKKGIVKVKLPPIEHPEEPYLPIDNLKEITGVKAREMTRKERRYNMKRSLASVVLELPKGVKLYCFIGEIEEGNGEGMVLNMATRKKEKESV